MFNRRLLAVSLMVAGCSLAASSYAQDTGPRDGPRGHRPDAAPREMREARSPLPKRPARMLRQLDSNEDGIVTLDEFTARGTANYSRQFERADRNDDGYITEDEIQPRRRGPAEDIDVAELRACIAAAGGEVPPEADRFAAADKDGDGALSQEEFFLLLEQRAYDQFARLDVDGDGQLTLEELQSDTEDRHEQRDIVRECVAEQLPPTL